MLENKKLKTIVVLPAYNAEKTLKRTYMEIPHDCVDEIILVDDFSKDDTFQLAKDLGIDHVLRHDSNKGYGGNQKTCYQKALECHADIIIMLHPDYQYTPKLIPSMISLISSNLYDVVLASRILGNGAIRGGMPFYKYIANRILTFIQNILLNHKLSEYHTGYRAFSRKALESINFMQNSDDFVFDNEILSQLIHKNFAIAEITCPTKYFEDASSINLQRSIVYGLGVLKTSVTHFLSKLKLIKSNLYL